MPKIISPTNSILRAAMYNVFEGRCFYTDRKLTKNTFSIDHVLPKAHGGLDIVENYAASWTIQNVRAGSAYCPVETKRYLQIIVDYFAPRVHEEMERLKAIKKQEWIEAYQEKRSNLLREVDSRTPNTLARDARGVGARDAAWLLMFTSIPYRRWFAPKTEPRRLGQTRVSYSIAENAEAPSQIYARLILAWICDKVAQGASNRIGIGDSVGSFASELGLGCGSIFPGNKLWENMYGLSQSEMLIETPSGTERIELMQAPVDLEAGAQLHLSDRFYEMIAAAPFRLDMSVLRKIGESPMRFDLFCWIHWCAQNQLLPIEITWEQLRMRLGTERQGKLPFSTYARHQLRHLELDRFQCEVCPYRLVIHGLR